MEGKDTEGWSGWLDNPFKILIDLLKSRPGVWSLHSSERAQAKVGGAAFMERL